MDIHKIVTKKYYEWLERSEQGYNTLENSWILIRFSEHENAVMNLLLTTGLFRRKWKNISFLSSDKKKCGSYIQCHIKMTLSTLFQFFSASNSIPQQIIFPDNIVSLVIIYESVRYICMRWVIEKELPILCMRGQPEVLT